MTVYCDITLLKDRLLIAVNDTQYDDALNNAVNEASRLVDLFLKPYTNVPLNDADEQIEAITADFGASIFKRRMLPDEVRMRGTDILQPDLGAVDATGWFALALRKIEQYIKNYYVLTQAFAENGNVVHNPRIYLQLLKEGIITGKEAREMMNKATAELSTEIQEICRTLTTDEVVTLTKDVTDTLNQTVSKALTTEDLQNITRSIADTISKGITTTLNDTQTIEVTKNLVTTLAENISRTLGTNETVILSKDVTDVLNQTISKTLTTSDIQNIARVLNDTIVKDLTTILNDTQTIEILKTLEQHLTDVITQTIEKTETLTKTETLVGNATVSEYKTKRQKSFVFVKSDEDSGYEVE